ncbi:MAG: guanylate kinase [Oscillospiraceae bacterium]
MKGNLIVLVGPSGSGKGTVLKEFLKESNNTFLSVSATTRAPREGEENGVHYHFISKEKFMQNISNNMMLEYATYCDNMYGTPKQAVDDHINNGENVILEIEMQGAKQIKDMYADAILVFIIPPNLKVLKERLVGRGTESVEVIEKRMNTALKELEFFNKCDYVIINDIVENAVSDLKSIVKANSLKTKNMNEFIEGVILNA